MQLNSDDFERIVERANLAPSVHNTQPTRWRRMEDGSVLVLEDVTRRLHVADAAGRDAAVSHGSAIEGFALACAELGRAVEVEKLDAPEQGGLRPVARLTFGGDATRDPLSSFVDRRRSYRGTFAKGAAVVDAAPLLGTDVTLVSTPTGIARIAELNDVGAMRTYRDKAYRRELVSWLRLSRRDPRYPLDGLSAEAMEMSSVQAAGAGIILAPRVFEALDAIGIASALVAEAAAVRSAQTIVLFHRPIAEDPLFTGRRFYRLWLEFAKIGLAAAPMSVLADDADIRATIVREFALPEERRLINAFRLGVPPSRTEPARARLQRQTLIAPGSG